MAELSVNAAGKIRVLHIITRLDRGGSAENTLLTVAGMQPELYETALAVGPTLGPRSPTEDVARQRGVAFLDVPHLMRSISPLKELAALWELWRLIRCGDYHIVHTHTSKGGVIGRLAAWLANSPIIIHTPHGHVFYGYYGPAVTRVFIWLERWAARFTDRIIALTAIGAEDHVHLGVAPRQKFVVIHSGIDFSRFDGERPDGHEARKSLGLPAQGVVIGTVGRLTAIKGPDDLVRAFAHAGDQLAQAHLLFVGEGEERESLQALAQELGVADRVVFAGWRQDLPTVYAGMDIFAFPSYNEGMGKALVEAMYAGMPSVASRVGGIPELVEPGCEGLLVPAKDPPALAAALIELAQDEALRGRMAKAAKVRAQGYSVGHMVDKIESLYEGLLKEKGIARR